jgi:amidase
MGSLRLPAAACGLVTLKPGRGVIPAGIGADSWSGMAVNGALATTAADLALVTAVLAGTDPSLAPGASGPLRVAVSTRSPLPGIRLDAAGHAAIEAVAEALRGAGHTVVRKEATVPTAAGTAAVLRWFAGADADAEVLGLDRRAMEPRSRGHAAVGRLVRRAGLVRPAAAEAFRDRLEAFFGDVDVLLTPVVTGPPLAARPWHERGTVANLTANSRWAPWPAAWNLAGLPALVLPAGPGRGRLPTAVQLAAPAGGETRLLWLAGELERLLPWRRYAPVFDPLEQAGAVVG